ncbi:MAG TPA: hypothetical protein ENJ82_09900 [Bacteroidetes bacterium]|nr:hypothetical protein [Bacteroidota bacterium]
MHEVEPFYGWLKYYTSEQDANSPFFEVIHNEFEYDRQVYQYLAHPQWDHIDSESLLVKILYADYENGVAILELFGVWNDLLENDYRLLADNCLSYLIDAGVNRFVLIMENVLNVYVDLDDYYEAIQDELGDGWICLLRAREHVKSEFQEHNIDQYFFWSQALDELLWRKLKPAQLYQKVENKLAKLLC